MIDFYIVDVFAGSQKFTGNQVAVFKSDSLLSDEEMLQVAREMNFSQSCFILSEKAPYKVRIFMPAFEVTFSGDPTLAAAHVINQFICDTPKEAIQLELKSGVVEILQQGDIYWMESPQPCYGREFDKVLLARVLSLNREDLCSESPIQQVSIGVPYIIVPVKDIKTLKSIQINSERYDWLTQRAKASCVLAYCTTTIDEGNDYHVRVFAGVLGIPEDPASGSGIGSFAAYLSKYSLSAEEGFEIQVEQGYEIGRPSLIKSKVHQLDDHVQIAIGGRTKVSSRGKIL